MPYQDVGYEIRTVSNLLKRNIFGTVSHPEDDDFTDMQGQLLAFIFDNSGKDVFQKDVEENFCIRRSTASRLLKNLEQRGLILREQVAHDARLKKLTPTPKATAIHYAVETRIRDVETRITCGISEEELVQFHKTMEKIKENLS